MSKIKIPTIEESDFKSLLKEIQNKTIEVKSITEVLVAIHELKIIMQKAEKLRAEEERSTVQQKELPPQWQRTHSLEKQKAELMEMYQAAEYALEKNNIFRIGNYILSKSEKGLEEIADLDMKKASINTLAGLLTGSLYPSNLPHQNAFEADNMQLFKDRLMLAAKRLEASSLSSYEDVLAANLKTIAETLDKNNSTEKENKFKPDALYETLMQGFKHQGNSKKLKEICASLANTYTRLTSKTEELKANTSQLLAHSDVKLSKERDAFFKKDEAKKGKQSVTIDISKHRNFKPE